MRWPIRFRSPFVPNRQNKTRVIYRGYPTPAASTVDRLTQDWTTTSAPVDEILRGALPQIRARSRERYMNDDYARRFVKMCQNNVVGSRGILFQARVKDPDGRQDNLANESIETAWKLWGRREQCDITRRFPWVDLQRIAISSFAIDGEVFAKIVLPQNREPFKFALQIIDPELIDSNLNKPLPGGAYIRLGIEYNALGEPTAYYVGQPLPSTLSYAYSRVIDRIPAEQMVHAFIPEMVGQSRGLPWMSAALWRMKMLVGYEDAALVAARVGAAKMGWWEVPEEDKQADEEDEEQGQQYEVAEPGVFGVGPAGAKLNNWSPEYPRGEFPDFIKATLRGIASGLGISYAALSNDLESTSYSSGRIGVIEEREAWKTIQDFMIATFCTPIYERWLTYQLTYGTLLVPSTKNGGFVALPPERFEKFRQVGWQARRWDWVDPQSDQEANRASLQMKLRSRSQIIREQGDEPQEIWEEIRDEEQLMKTLGIDPAITSGTAPPKPAEMPMQPAGNGKGGGNAAAKEQAA